MNTVKIPQGYLSPLGVRDTEKALKVVKDTFEDELANALNLERISAPMFVLSKNGINDDLSGVERAVSFDIKELNGMTAEIVHSLAKWKRMALDAYGFVVGEGLYTDMNAIRRDDSIDNIHSIYVDQWDWERVIADSDRTEDFLREIVTKIVHAICNTLDKVKIAYPIIKTELDRNVYFISSEELLQKYPDLTSKERENAIVKEHNTVFITKIGGLMSNGESHDSRAPDYDDWNLNGDLMFYNKVLDEAIEISSMGVRVNAKSLATQLTAKDCMSRMVFSYHQQIANGSLPLTIGGGIGQSRLCLLLLGKAHIGEVQVSLWDETTKKICKEGGINIL